MPDGANTNRVNIEKQTLKYTHKKTIAVVLQTREAMRYKYHTNKIRTYMITINHQVYKNNEINKTITYTKVQNTGYNNY